MGNRVEGKEVDVYRAGRVGVVGIEVGFFFFYLDMGRLLRRSWLTVFLRGSGFLVFVRIRVVGGVGKGKG